MKTVSELKVEAFLVRGKILALVGPLEAARVAMIQGKQEQSPGLPLFKAWKKLDDQDSELRLREVEMCEEIDDLED